MFKNVVEPEVVIAGQLPFGATITISVSANGETLLEAETEVVQGSPKVTTIGSIAWPRQPNELSVSCSLAFEGEVYRSEQAFSGSEIIDAGTTSEIWYKADDRSISERLESLDTLFAPLIAAQDIEPFIARTDAMEGEFLPPVIQEYSGFELDPEAMYEPALGVYGALERKQSVARLLDYRYASPPSLYEDHSGLTLLYQNGRAMISDTGNGGHMEALAWVPPEDLGELLKRPSMHWVRHYEDGLWYAMDDGSLFSPTLYTSSDMDLATAKQAVIAYVGRRFIDERIGNFLNLTIDRDPSKSVVIDSARPGTSIWCYFNTERREFSVDVGA